MDPVYERIKRVSKAAAAEKAITRAGERGMAIKYQGKFTRAFMDLFNAIEDCERERHLFAWHTGGFRPDYLAGVA